MKRFTPMYPEPPREDSRYTHRPGVDTWSDRLNQCDCQESTQIRMATEKDGASFVIRLGPLAAWRY